MAKWCGHRRASEKGVWNIMEKNCRTVCRKEVVATIQMSDGGGR